MSILSNGDQNRYYIFGASESTSGAENRQPVLRDVTNAMAMTRTPEHHSLDMFVDIDIIAVAIEALVIEAPVMLITPPPEFEALATARTHAADPKQRRQQH